MHSTCKRAPTELRKVIICNTPRVSRGRFGVGKYEGENHDPGGSTEPGGGKTKIKGRSVSGSLDQMGLPQEEDHMGGFMEIGTFPHLLPVRSM